MTLMFSATFPKEIQKLAQAFMRRASREKRARGSRKGGRSAGAGDGCSFRLVSMETNRETEALMWVSMISMCGHQKEPSLPKLLDFKLLSLLERPFCWQPTSFDLSWPVSGSAKGNPAKWRVSMFQVCGEIGCCAQSDLGLWTWTLDSQCPQLVSISIGSGLDLRAGAIRKCG